MSDVPTNSEEIISLELSWNAADFQKWLLYLQRIRNHSRIFRWCGQIILWKGREKCTCVVPLDWSVRPTFEWASASWVIPIVMGGEGCLYTTEHAQVKAWQHIPFISLGLFQMAGCFSYIFCLLVENVLNMLHVNKKILNSSKCELKGRLDWLNKMH